MPVEDIEIGSGQPQANEPAAAPTGGDTGQPAPAPGQTPPAQGAEPAAPAAQPAEGTTPQAQQPERGPVSFEQFDEARQQLAAAQAQNEQLRDYFRQQQQQGQPQGQQQQPDPRAILQQLGITSDDLLTDEGLARYTNALNRANQQNMMALMNQLRGELLQAVNQSRTPDLQQIVGTVNPYTGQAELAKPLQDFNTRNPHLAALTSRLALYPEGQQLIYSLVKNDPAYAQSQQQQAAQTRQTTQTQLLDQVREMNQAPLSPSALGQPGAEDSAGIVRNWTEEQLQDHIDKARAQVG